MAGGSSSFGLAGQACGWAGAARGRPISATPSVVGPRPGLPSVRCRKDLEPGLRLLLVRHRLAAGGLHRTLLLQRVQQFHDFQAQLLAGQALDGLPQLALARRLPCAQRQGGGWSALQPLC